MKINENFSVTKPYSSYQSRQRYVISAKEKSLEFKATFTGSSIADKILNLVSYDIVAFGDASLDNALVDNADPDKKETHFSTVKMTFDRRYKTVTFEGIEHTVLSAMSWVTPILSVQFTSEELVYLIRFLLEGSIK